MQNLIRRATLLLFCFLGLLSAHSADAQDDTSGLTLKGYVEAYYMYSLNEWDLPFNYNYVMHNQFTPNLALVQAHYNTKNARAAFGLQAGTYAIYNYAQEPSFFQYLYEANAGVRVGKGVWVDVGVFSSPYGFESAVGQKNWTLTRSLTAENSPYYVAGLKTGWKINDQWQLTGFILNGWQQIYDRNRNKAVGTQLTFTPNKNLTLNSSTFVGNESYIPGSRRMRYFHDLYAKMVMNRWGLIAGFDIGMEQKTRNVSDGYNNWWNATLILRYKLSNKAAMAARGEYMSDPDQVIVETHMGRGYEVTGASLNFDYNVQDNVLFRIEAKAYSAKEDIFRRRSALIVNTDLMGTASLSVAF